MHRECRERFPRHRHQRSPLVSVPGIHHGTCVTTVPWCISGSLTRDGAKNIPGIPSACTTRNFTYLARGPFVGSRNVLCNRLEQLERKVNRTNETRRRYVRIVFLSSFMGPLCLLSNKIMYTYMYCRKELFMRSLVCHFAVYSPRCFAWVLFWCLFFESFRAC